jgi:hypothetical protein
MALMPMGEGNFIMALREEIRKGIRKGEGRYAAGKDRI